MMMMMGCKPWNAFYTITFVNHRIFHFTYICVNEIWFKNFSHYWDITARSRILIYKMLQIEIILHSKWQPSVTRYNKSFTLYTHRIEILCIQAQFFTLAPLNISTSIVVYFTIQTFSISHPHILSLTWKWFLKKGSFVLLSSAQICIFNFRPLHDTFWCWWCSSYLWKILCCFIEKTFHTLSLTK